MSLPKHVMILGQRWRVKVVPDLKDSDESCDGLTHYEDRLIEVNADLPVPEQYQVLFHELMHASFGITGTSCLIKGDGETRKDNEEVIIRSLEYSLWPVIKYLTKKGAR